MQKGLVDISSMIYSPGGSTRREVGPAYCRTPILEERFEAVGNGNTLITLGQNLGNKGLTDVSQILTWSEWDVALSYAKEIASTSSAFWAQTTNYERDRQTNHRTVTSIAIYYWRNCLSALSPKNLALRYLLAYFKLHNAAHLCSVKHTTINVLTIRMISYRIESYLKFATIETVTRNYTPAMSKNIYCQKWKKDICFLHP